MPNPLHIAIAVLAIVAAAFYHTSATRGLKNDYEGRITVIEDRHRQELAMIEEVAAAQRARDMASLTAALKRSQASDEVRTRELNDEKMETERLRGIVDSGHGRVFVRATCPASPASSDREASPAASTSVAHGAAVELPPGTRQSYFRLRDGIAEDRQKILGLQEHIRILQSFCNPNGD